MALEVGSEVGRASGSSDGDAWQDPQLQSELVAEILLVVPHPWVVAVAEVPYQYPQSVAEVRQT